MKKAFSLAVLVVLAAAPLSGWELSVAGSGGVHLPTQRSFRDVYGSTAAFSLDLRWLATPDFGVTAGVMTWNKRGEAVSLDGGSEAFGVDFRVVSVPLTAFWHLARGRIGIDLGAGLAYHDFKERWVDEGGPEYAGAKWGVLLSASAAYDITPRLSIVGTARYLDIRTGRASRLAEEVNLGGFQVLAGVSWTFVK